MGLFNKLKINKLFRPFYFNKEAKNKNNKVKESKTKRHFFKDVKAELKKVIWPTKKQLIHNTIMVVILVVALSVIVLGFDMILEFADAKLWDIIGRKIG